MPSLRNLLPFYFVGFLFASHTALVLYSNSSFLNQFIDDSYIGLLYTGGSILALIGLAIVPKALRRFGSRPVMITLALIILAICAVNIFVHVPWIILACFTLFFSGNIMFFLANDIVIDQTADNDDIMGTVRGSYISALHIGYVVAPGLAGFILARLGFSALYGLAGFVLIPLIILLIKTISVKQVNLENNTVSTRKSFQKVFQNKNLRNILGANFILQFFYSWMIIYSPLYLQDILGIPWDSIGTIFSIMLLAFVFIPLPIGRLADRSMGEKPLLFLAFLVLAGSTSLLYFLPYFTLPLLALILFITRVGASAVETLTESYFFKNSPQSETGAVGILRSTYPVAYIIAPIIASVIVTVAPMKYLFLILSIICLLGIFFILPITNTQQKKSL